MDAIRDAYNWLRATWLGLLATTMGNGMSWPDVLNGCAAAFTILASVVAIWLGLKRHKLLKRQTCEMSKTQHKLRDHIDDASLPPAAAMSIATQIERDRARKKDV